jgi:hypothetical protein
MKQTVLLRQAAFVAIITVSAGNAMRVSLSSLNVRSLAELSAADLVQVRRYPLWVVAFTPSSFVILALYFDVRLLAIFFVPQINIGFSVFSLMLLVVNLWKTRSDAYLRLVLPRHSSPLDPAPLSHPSLLTYFLFSPP